MSKKCIKCGQLIPDEASFCPHCTAVQTEKKEIKPPRRWKKKALIILTILILSAVVGTVFFMHHKPKNTKAARRSFIRIKINHIRFC